MRFRLSREVEAEALVEAAGEVHLEDLEADLQPSAGGIALDIAEDRGVDALPLEARMELEVPAPELVAMLLEVEEAGELPSTSIAWRSGDQ